VGEHCAVARTDVVEAALAKATEQLALHCEQQLCGEHPDVWLCGLSLVAAHARSLVQFLDNLGGNQL
jgi:hypothetical protein